MISKGEVISSTYQADKLTEVMLGDKWWDRYEFHWWEKPYPCHHHHVSHDILISNGTILTAMESERLIAVMTGYRFWFDVGNSPYDPSNLAYWPYYLITAGEVITDTKDMDDLTEIMTGNPYSFGGCSPYPDLLDIISDDEDTDWRDESDDYDTPEWDEADYEPDVDEAQEWHDFDPDC